MEVPEIAMSATRKLLNNCPEPFLRVVSTVVELSSNGCLALRRSTTVRKPRIRQRPRRKPYFDLGKPCSSVRLLYLWRRLLCFVRIIVTDIRRTVEVKGQSPSIAFELHRLTTSQKLERSAKDTPPQSDLVLAGK